MDDRITVFDIEVKLVQRFRAGGDEILLDVHRDVWALKLAPQRVTIAAKLALTVERKSFTEGMDTTGGLRTCRLASPTCYPPGTVGRLLPSRRDETAGL
jgi:hypothetical protein